MKTRFYWLVAGALLWASVLNGQAQEAGQLDCSTCHDQPKEIVGTAHASLSCLTCHPKHDTFPHPEGFAKPTCAKCHAQVADRFRLGIHGRMRAAGNKSAPVCNTCHGDIHKVKLTGTEAFRESVPGICGNCHTKIFAQYKESVHGKAVSAGIIAAPVCSSCHGEHEIQPPTSSTSPVSPTHIPETCGRCHGNVRLTERFNLPRNSLVSYEESFHGLALKSGRETVANCASCHGVHAIFPPSDPRSTINPKNLPKTCGRCHPGAGTRFAIGQMHIVAGRSEPAAIGVVRDLYRVLIPLVIGLMLLYVLGDWVRKLVRFRLKPTGGVLLPPARVRRSPSTFRMYRFERIQHGLLVLTFAVLVWTGFALKYSGEWWAWPLVRWESRWPVRGTVHRIAGAVFIGLCITHVISLIRNRKLRDHWKELWPRHSDVQEAVSNFAYNLGLRRQRPRVSSHSYVEKLEYWAVVWGGVVMALTGVTLWATTFILTWFPKITLDVASTIHFYEAVLATLAIVVWHFYTVIFDPDVYPMDTAWLTGYSVRKREPPEETEAAKAHPPAPKEVDGAKGDVPVSKEAEQAKADTSAGDPPPEKTD